MTGKERLLRQFRMLEEAEVAIHKVTDWQPLTFEGYKSASEYFQDFQSLSKFEASLLDLLANTEYESARRLMYTLKTKLDYKVPEGPEIGPNGILNKAVQTSGPL